MTSTEFTGRTREELLLAIENVSLFFFEIEIIFAFLAETIGCYQRSKQST